MKTDLVKLLKYETLYLYTYLRLKRKSIDTFLNGNGKLDALIFPSNFFYYKK